MSRKSSTVQVAMLAAEDGLRSPDACVLVRTQAATVCQKLGVDSRQQAALKALRLGILHLDEASLRREIQQAGEGCGIAAGAGKEA